MNESLSIGIISIVICFFLAEFFGRSKHIGRWWTFFLLLSGLIPGIIAVITSPSAKKKPTQGGKSYTIWGWICLVFGAGNTITFIGSEGKTGQLFFAFLLISYYLFELSKGHIINKEPKYYFDNLKFNSSTFSNQFNTNSDAGNFSSNSDDINTNLKNLRDRGLLTQSEYLNKLKKIEAEKGQNILKSDGYLELKQLYDTEVLNTAEFYSKLELLANSVAPIIPEKKKNNYQIYYLIAGILIVIAFLINWNEVFGELKYFNDSYNKGTQEIETPVVNTNFETVKSMEPINPTKFVYILFKIKEPKFLHLDGFTQLNDNLVYEQVIKDRNEVFWEEVIYTTGIKEIKDFNEDAKYRLLDEVEPEVRMKLGYADSNFSNEVYGKCSETDKKASLVENHSELIDKNIFVFDSYKEASIHRANAISFPEKFSESTFKYSVNQTRTYFYSEPNDESIKKAFLIYGENFQSSQVVNNFVYVIYTNISGKETKGWIKVSDLSRE